jgi:hypothetical protein
LRQGRTMVSMHEGWNPGWLVWFGDCTVSPRPMGAKFGWIL